MHDQVDDRPESTISDKALDIAPLLAGLHLLIADKLLDEARRLVWGVLFSGESLAETARLMGASAAALEVAMAFNDTTGPPFEPSITPRSNAAQIAFPSRYFPLTATKSRKDSSDH